MGFYGVDCIEKCGQCRDIDQCHHINGACLTGCEAGYHGDLCKARRYRCNNDNVQLMYAYGNEYNILMI